MQKIRRSKVTKGHSGGKYGSLGMLNVANKNAIKDKN